MLKVGVIREISPFEGRVALTPSGAAVLVKNGIDVFVEENAGEDCQFKNYEYERAGAVVLPTSEKVVQKAELILKILPLKPVEYELLSEKHILLSFSDYNSNTKRLNAFMNTKAVFFSAELLQNKQGEYAVLSGMSEIAGKMVISQAAQLLTNDEGGKGILLQGTRVSKAANLIIVGAGQVGRTAAVEACHSGADVTLLALKPEKLEQFSKEFPKIKVEKYSEELLRELLPKTDVLIVALFSLHTKIDVTISREMVNLMEKGSVIIDVSVAKTNVVETSHITDHGQPSFVIDGIVHYCVPNIPARVPITASQIHTKSILPFVKMLAMKGLKKAIEEEPGFLTALIIYKGKITNRVYAELNGDSFYNIFELLEMNL
jgi:alanine dehydrogenase